MFNSRKFLSVAGLMLIAGSLGLAPDLAHARKGDCAQPFSDNAGGPLATDCLFILQAATGSRTCDTDCICDPQGNGNIVASDALLCLVESVGAIALNCNCPDLQDAAFAFAATDCPFASQDAAAVATNYVGAFPQDVAQATGNWTAGWTLELNGGNNTVWDPVPAAPAANAACPAGTTDIGNATLPAAVGGGTMDVCRLAARYNTDEQTITLTNDNVYRLGGAANQGTKFGDGDAADKGPGNTVNTHLVIQEGTLVLGEESEALAITRGSDVDINGTAANPVVMMSVETFNAWAAGGNGDGSRGEWGGFVLSGFAPANQCPDATFCDFQIEGFLTPFFSGGTAPADDSGDIEYLVVAQAGFDIDGNGNELNGITIFQVGTGTNLSFVQVHENVDDGIEFFGGGANVDHAVVTDVQDDSIDSDLGYRGLTQFAVVRQSADLNADRGFEMDSHPTPAADTLISQPCFVNTTVLGSSAALTEGANVGSGTNAYFANDIFKDNTEFAIDMEDGTLALRGAGLQIHDSYVCAVAGTARTNELNGSNAPDTDATVQAWFDADVNNRRCSAGDAEPGVNSIGYPSQEP